ELDDACGAGAVDREPRLGGGLVDHRRVAADEHRAARARAVEPADADVDRGAARVAPADERLLPAAGGARAPAEGLDLRRRAAEPVVGERDVVGREVPERAHRAIGPLAARAAEARALHLAEAAGVEEAFDPLGGLVEE